MKYAFFRGCIIPYRISYYELSARRVLTRLGIELVDLDFGCCGSQMVESRNEGLWLALAARNLALSEREGLNILTLCGSCANVLSRAKHLLKSDEDKAHHVKQILRKIGLEFKNEARAVHILKLLAEETGIGKIKKHIKKTLDFKVAFQHPCQIYRPSETMTFTKDAVKDLAASFISDIFHVDACCGATLIATNQDVCMGILRQNLETCFAEDRDLIITACGNCQMTYDVNQLLLKVKDKIATTLPSLSITQALGIAMGYGYDELGLGRNLIKIDNRIFS
ncbi:putative CoB--CoM heterodisulfide reductase 1 subunit B [uncultured Desulfobacterium sp.]|uniref:Putative CoB--CoM heterodisulfide reductase 1 subunit B n=1 Tax=uncultured Desulfobacterium sp. TaxID=201089 RepID=A0A445MYZ1_9BACT|nr:putative CoB--CoM heterodisulfide reductase 1 subunit B [uncultured Desulfobacterium sp.]